MSSLSDVTKRLEKGNQKAEQNTDDVVAGLELVAESIVGNAMTKEEKMEAGARQDRMVQLLEIIAENTAGGAAGGSQPDIEPPTEEGMGIGKIGAIVAGSAGILAGAIAGWLQAVKKVFEILTPNKILMPIQEFFGKVGNFFKAISETVGSVFAKIGGFLKGIMPSGDILAPFAKGISAVKGFFSGIGSYMSSFAKVFGSVFKIASKIFYPLTLIMTAWDTVKGAFEGYAEDGFIGGILGGIEGLVNSLIMMPLDLIKGAVSWIAGFLGFENVEATLDSFSFEDMFSSVIDAIKEFLFAIPGYVVDGFTWLGEQMSALGDAIHENLIKPIVDLFQEYVIDPLAELFAPIGEWFSSKMRMLMGFLEDFGIPAISFDIPLYGDVTLGPWYPFRTEGSDEGTTAIEAETTSSTQITSSSDGTTTESEQFRDYVKTVGSHIDATGDEEFITNDVTAIMVSDSSSMNGDYTANDAFLTFDTTTGISEYNGMEVDKDVYMAGKLAAMDGATTAEIELAMAREAAYNQLNWWNSAKALAGGDPIALLSEQEGQSYDVASLVPGASGAGDALMVASTEVADGNRAAGAGAGNTVVAPTNNVVNNTTNQVGRRDVRPSDPSLNIVTANGFS